MSRPSLRSASLLALLLLPACSLGTTDRYDGRRAVDGADEAESVASADQASGGEDEEASPSVSLGDWDGSELGAGQGLVDNTGRFSAQTAYGAVEVDLNVAGNATSESLRSLWPLTAKLNWKMAGVTRRGYYANVPADSAYRLQVKTEAPEPYEGQLTTPVDFVKETAGGYWEPNRNQNLRWYLVDFAQSAEPMVWSRGARTLDRSKLPAIEQASRYRYETVAGSEVNPDLGRPNAPYVLYASTIKANATNSGLGNALVTRHEYSMCGGADMSCVLSRSSHQVSWFAGVTNARIRAPFTGGAWRNAKRIKFMEISIDRGESLTAPYTSDRAKACAAQPGESRLHHAGVREDWYLVDGFGLAMIFQRPVGLGPKLECVYDVAREQLEFANAGTWAVTVKRETTGYDPAWKY